MGEPGFSQGGESSSSANKENDDEAAITFVSDASILPLSVVKKMADRSPSSSPSPQQVNKDDTDTSSSESLTSPSSSANVSSTPRDTLSNGSHSNGTYGGKDSDDSKEGERNKAVFDRVVLDASQRKHIREKHSRIDEGPYDTSDSSSGAAEAEVSVEPPQRRFDGGTNSDTGISSWQEEYPLSLHMRPNHLQASTSSGWHSRPREGPLGSHYNNLKRPNSSQDGLWPNIPSGGSGSFGREGERERKRKRFYRTFTTLRQCGLMEITMQTASLMEENRKLQEQIKNLKAETATTYAHMLQIAKANPAFLKQESAAEVMKNLEQIVSEEDKSQMRMAVHLKQNLLTEKHNSEKTATNHERNIKHSLNCE